LTPILSSCKIQSILTHTESDMQEYPTQQVLELACAAQRFNKGYLKEEEAVYVEQGTVLFFKISNKALMRYTLDPEKQVLIGMEAYMTKLSVTDEDVAQAEEIKKYFRKFMFGAIAGENDFQTSINTILTGDGVKINQFGYVACLPSVYARDLAQTKIKKASRQVDEEYLAEIGAQLNDLDAEIISSVKSKNFEGYNIDAIINNKMVSWINKSPLELGPCVIVKAKVKDHTKHWKHENHVTRLNYVKAAQ
jgi:hypothetical protein